MDADSADRRPMRLKWKMPKQRTRQPCRRPPPGRAWASFWGLDTWLWMIIVEMDDLYRWFLDYHGWFLDDQGWFLDYHGWLWIIMDDHRWFPPAQWSGDLWWPSALPVEVRSEMARAVKELEIAAKVAAERRKKSAKNIMSDNTCVYVLCIDWIIYIIYTHIYIYTAIYCSYVCVCMCIYTSINNRCTVVSYLWQRRHATEIGSLNAKLESERAQLESSHKEAQLRIFFEWMSIGNPGDIIRILGWNMDQVPSGKLT